jgi:V/A-type H+-transporting ATPase subunit E
LIFLAHETRVSKGGNTMTEENIELNRRVEQFLAAIRGEGAQSCADIRSKAEAEIDAALAEARNKEKAKAEETERFEAQRAEAQRNRRMSEGRASLRAELARQRDTLQKEVFAAAEQKLADFAQTSEYAAWLQKSAATIAARLGACTLYARTADLPLLKGNLPAGCSLSADDSIRLGGLKGAAGEQAADDTLEARLAAQRGWFLENSGLSIHF